MSLENKRDFEVGDNVYVYDSKRECTFFGRIIKITVTENYPKSFLLKEVHNSITRRTGLIPNMGYISEPEPIELEVKHKKIFKDKISSLYYMINIASKKIKKCKKQIKQAKEIIEDHERFLKEPLMSHKVKFN